MGMKTPVLLIAFRRPDLTEQVLAALRGAAPERLYVAIDGPRSEVPGEIELVHRVQDLVVAAVDWDCQIQWRIRSANLGCRRGVVDALDWFLGIESEGIILEDDCVPAPDFFPFCEQLLERYRFDFRVLSVGGDNSGEVTFAGPWSYGFVRHPAVWGWATWRRAWDLYDRDMNLWGAVRGTELVQAIFPDELERHYRSRIFDRLLDHGEPDTWDYQWSATCFLTGGLTVMPARNLVANLGFRDDATHTTASSALADAPTGSVLPLEHPPIVCVDWRAEAQVVRKVDGQTDRGSTSLRAAFQRLFRS